mgnify:CR=1 FL=1
MKRITRILMIAAVALAGLSAVGFLISVLFQQYLNISAVIRKMTVPSEDVLLHQSFVKNKKRTEEL